MMKIFEEEVIRALATRASETTVISPWFTLTAATPTLMHRCDNSFQSSSTLKWVRSTYSRRNTPRTVAFIYCSGFPGPASQASVAQRQPLKFFLLNEKRKIRMSTFVVTGHSFGFSVTIKHNHAAPRDRIEIMKKKLINFFVAR